MSDKKNPSLVQGSDFSGKSTANTGFSTKQKSNLGRKLVQELVDSGIPIDLQHLLNYKYVSKEEAFQLMGYRWSGWVVPYLDLDGKPYLHNGKPFYRIKPDAGQLKGYKPPKYLTIGGAGNRPYFSPLLKVQNLIKDIKGDGDVIITEGEKGTDSLVLNGFTTIGLAGVWSWTDGRVDKYELLPELEAINWKNKNAYICFDSDLVIKDGVKHALKELSKALTKRGAKVKVVILPCDFDGSKNGADDFLVKYGREALIKVLGIAREAHDKNKRFIWTEEPTKSHHTAVLASIVFKNHYALRPSIGLYKWVGTKWLLLEEEKANDAIDLPLHDWYDEMNWEKREQHHWGSVKKELLTRIKHSEWNRPDLMSFKNGTLDINKQFFNKTHNRKHYLTHSFDFKYDEQAKCPLWNKFLDETFENNQEIIELLRAAFKWSISPKDNTKPYLIELNFDLFGRNGTGKGTILEILQAVAGGEEAIGSLTSSTLSNRNSRFGLIEKKIALDFDACGHIGEAGIFNSIVSNEPVPVERKYFDVAFKRLGVVIWRAFNDNPTASGGGVEGLGRRLLTFKLNKKPAKSDPNLKTKLLAEIEGIFWWCWSMDDNKMFDVLRNKGNIEAVRKASIENQLQNQPVLEFIYQLNGEDYVQSSVLYKNYKDWCEENGKKPVTHTRFGLELNKMEGFVQKDDSSSCNYYSISKTENINLAEHFGITNNGGLNTKSEKVTDPNPQLSNLPTEQEKEKSIEGLYSSPYKNNFKNKNNSKDIKKDRQQTLETLNPSINGSAWDTASGDEDPYWN